MFLICPVLIFRVCGVQVWAGQGREEEEEEEEEKEEEEEEERRKGLSPPVFACSGILEPLVQGLHVQVCM
jgi:hypothetical protein